MRWDWVAIIVLKLSVFFMVSLVPLGLFGDERKLTGVGVDSVVFSDYFFDGGTLLFVITSDEVVPRKMYLAAVHPTSSLRRKLLKESKVIARSPHLFALSKNGCLQGADFFVAGSPRAVKVAEQMKASGPKRSHGTTDDNIIDTVVVLLQGKIQVLRWGQHGREALLSDSPMSIGVSEKIELREAPSFSDLFEENKK